MNRKELILDFIKWYWHHHVRGRFRSKFIDHQNISVDEYLEMLEAVEDLNDELPVKIWCIEFERELEGKDVIHIYRVTKPTIKEAEDIIENEGYIFNKGYDQVNEIYEV